MKLVLVVLALLAATATAHLCMIEPRQRGAFDISKPASPSCFRPPVPCGGQAEESPLMTVRGGSLLAVLVQQNLNHFNPGNTGFLDASWSTAAAPTTQAQFVQLANYSDWWAHNQATQTNLTLLVRVPDVDCASCTLQARYHPNKPTEPIFHQCTNLRVVRSSSTSPFAPLNFGEWTAFTLPATPDGRDVFSLAADGSMTHSRALSPGWLTDGLFGVYRGAPLVGSVGLPNAATGMRDSVSLLRLDGTSFSSVSFVANSSFATTGGQLTAVSGGTTAAPLAAAWIATDAGTGRYHVSMSLSSADAVNLRARVSPSFTPDNTFVNFLWFQAADDLLLALVGDENSPYALDSRLFVWSPSTGAHGYFVVSPTWGFNSFYYEQSSHTLFALAPFSGDLSTAAADSARWNVIAAKIDVPAAAAGGPLGTLSFAVQCASLWPAGMYEAYYGGAVYGAQVSTAGWLYQHMYRRADHAPHLVAVNLASCAVEQTAIDFQHLDSSWVERQALPIGHGGLGAQHGYDTFSFVRLPPTQAVDDAQSRAPHVVVR